MEEGQKYFIADANFFIEGNTIIKAPPKIYTTQDALNEVRDHRAKQMLDMISLSHEIITKEPSQESLEIVTQTATDSGNIVLLSETDIRLIALALDFQPQQQDQQQQEQKTPGFDEWITESTLGQLEDVEVTLCTADTTMQCVSLLLGIHVISPNGVRVAEVKRWLLRCAACGAETLDASKEFCPECGQHELVRYALVMRAGVERELPLPKRFEPTPKGKRFTIPNHRGGRHAKKQNIVLSEDMLQEAKVKFIHTGGKRTYGPKNEDGHTFFEPRKKARQEPQYGYGKTNPNVPNHLLGKKKKKNRQ